MLAMLFAMPPLSAAAESVVSTKKALVYSAPSAGSVSLTIPAGTVMELVSQRDGWICVKRGDVTAYMLAADVDAITVCDSIAAYTTAAAPMYKAYGKSAKYGTIPAGTAVTVLALAGDWAYVRLGNHRGFVSKSTLSTQEPDAAIDPDVTITGGLTAYVARDGAKAYKTYSTVSKVVGQLPANTELSVAAVRGSWALVTRSGKYAYMLVSDLSKNKITADAVPEEKPSAGSGIQAMDWWTSGIQTIFAKGVTATITDVATGISWQEIRKGGTNHADCQPLTAQDTANLKKAVGGKWSWDRRAVVVTINGQHYAASINCMPHGGGSVTGNNFDGHHCVHFINSRTAGTNKVDADHQAAIQKALALNAK